MIWVLSWNFQKMLKGEDHLTKRQYVQATINTTITATFTTFTTNTSSAAFIATTCKANRIEMNISKSI